MTQTEALRLALEALEFDSFYGTGKQEAITAIKAALEAKDEPVPVAIVEVFGKDWRLDYMALPVGKHKLYAQQYTYTTPPQRTWVGLTAEEREQVQAESYGKVPHHVALIATVEAKLKQKNFKE